MNENDNVAFLYELAWKINQIVNDFEKMTVSVQAFFFRVLVARLVMISKSS